MTRRVVHFEVEVLDDCVFQPACENAAGRDAIADVEREVEMTDDEREVTCKRCLKALGFEVPPVQIVDVEHLGPGRIAA